MISNWWPDCGCFMPSARSQPVSHVIHGYFTPVSHFHSNKLISESEVEHTRELTSQATHTEIKR